MSGHLTGQLEALKLSPDPISSELFLDAFKPDSKAEVRHLAITSLLRLQAESASVPFLPLIRTRLDSTSVSEQVSALSFLAAFYSISPDSAHQIISFDGILELISDAAESSIDVAVAVAELAGSAAMHQPSRTLFASNSQIIEWLQNAKASKKLAVLAGVARLKLDRTSKTGLTPSKEHVAAKKEQDQQLFLLLRDELVTQKQDRSTLLAILEGLTYLSLTREVKESISYDSQLLQSLNAVITFSARKPVFPSGQGVSSYDADPTLLDATRHDTALQYGVSSIISNLAAYPPPASGEEKQMAKLRKMANAEASLSEEKDEEVDQRCERLVDSGAVSTVVAIALSGGESAAVKATISALLLAMVTKQDKAHRGKVIQQGGVRALLTLSSDPIAAQALSKLLISSDPTLLSPTPLSFVGPVTALFLSASSTRLQMFETAMALTNLSSLAPALCERIAAAISTELEGRILTEDPGMLRRAYVELLCNLVQGDEGVFNRWCGGETRMKVLAAFCADEDVPTRKAACAVLAIVTGAQEGCEGLLNSVSDATLRELAANMNPYQLEGDKITEIQDEEVSLNRQDALDIELRAVSLTLNLLHFVTGETLERLQECDLIDNLKMVALREAKLTDGGQIRQQIVQTAVEALKLLK